MVVLYQTWKTLKLPPKYKANWEKWDEWAKKHSIEHVLLDDEGLRNLVAYHYPEYLDFYDNEITEMIEKVDFSRLVMLAKGGIYADLDTFPSDKNDPIKFIKTQNPRIVLGQEPIEHCQALYLRDSILCNAFMISPFNPKSKLFWERAMEFCIEHYEPHFAPVHNTGPMMLTKMMDQHPEYFKEADVLIVPSCYFYPLIAQQKVSRECNGFEDSYVIHEWTNSWSFKIWNDPIWKNRRHKIYMLSIFFGIMIIIIAATTFRKKRLRN